MRVLATEAPGRQGRPGPGAALHAGRSRRESGRGRIFRETWPTWSVPGRRPVGPNRRPAPASGRRDKKTPTAVGGRTPRQASW